MNVNYQDFYTYDQESQIIKQMYLQQQKYSVYKSINIQFLTLNCGDKYLNDTFFDSIDQNNVAIFVSLQEFDLDMTSILAHQSKRADLYVKNLNKRFPKFQIFVKQMGSMLMMILIQKYIQSTVTFQTVATGLMGKIANKGGILARIQILDTTLLVAGCHLSASRDRDGVKLRNADLHKILSGYQPQNKSSISSQYWASNLKCKPNVPDSFIDLDSIFIIGDLNYRVESQLSESSVSNGITSLDIYTQFKQGDQLLSQIEKWNLKNDENLYLNDISEQEFDFLPTYCLIPNESNVPSINIYATDPTIGNGKVRMPAFTDRVLQRLINYDIIFQATSYDSVPNYQISDHRPVTQLGTILIRSYDKRRMTETRQRIADDIKKQFYELMPKFTVEAQKDYLKITSLNSFKLNIIVQNHHQNQPLVLEVTTNSPFIKIDNPLIQIKPQSKYDFQYLYYISTLNQEISSLQILKSLFSGIDLNFILFFTHFHHEVLLDKRNIQIQVDTQFEQNILSSNLFTDSNIYESYIDNLYQIINQKNLIGYNTIKNTKFRTNFPASESDKWNSLSKLVDDLCIKHHEYQTIFHQIKNSNIESTSSINQQISLFRGLQYSEKTLNPECAQYYGEILTNFISHELQQFQILDQHSEFNILNPSSCKDFFYGFITILKFHAYPQLQNLIPVFNQIKNESKLTSDEICRQASLYLLETLEYKTRFQLFGLFMIENIIPGTIEKFSCLLNNKSLYDVIHFIYKTLRY
ncbi:Type II inositol-1,4,5-trisphosphate 5-phosphatase [Spironucleus salmonicida]|uniref:Endonuclease/Exonuclease/phosphatase family protein n=1 Tax=Spironucleus salmonicida TaxID=348837 RepID=V6LGV3_9EUKA|nr:Type II inositol-1,4,5-trisphosphate 5-phosphatase [Spironucleus salmonicida]|eukprot:EST43538.1 Endonuclease/Exonuclease/phosphatase family protein [Spironucleus salmonicida]